jgi:hypothetical protein
MQRVYDLPRPPSLHHRLRRNLACLPRLSHGMGVTRLADLPAEWSRQHRILGLPAQ